VLNEPCSLGSKGHKLPWGEGIKLPKGGNHVLKGARGLSCFGNYRVFKGARCLSDAKSNHVLEVERGLNCSLGQLRPLLYGDMVALQGNLNPLFSNATWLFPRGNHVHMGPKY